MNNIFNVGGNSNSDYFSNFFGTSSTGVSGSSNFLGDFYSIRNGSYLKLAKKYYASEAANKTSSKTTTDEKQTKLTQSSAQGAVSSVSKLMDSNLYKKVEKRDENGKVTYDYDRDNILKNIKSFVEDYNDTIKNLSEESNSSMLRTGVRLTNQTKIYQSALSKVGISINKGNTLELDEEAFGKANMTDVKSLFAGNVSFAKNVQSKLTQIYASANDVFAANDSLYSGTATKSLSTGNMLDSFM